MGYLLARSGLGTFGVLIRHGQNHNGAPRLRVDRVAINSANLRELFYSSSTRRAG